jgi:hypothetical protein
VPGSCRVPVVLMVFNRPLTTRRVFDQIARARPAKLLVIADGPRSDKPGDRELCRETRAITSAVDWPCEVLTSFASSNLGCGERIVSGLNWAFSVVDEAIILEDDCFPDLSFFPFCEELLDKYRGDSRIAAITGTNLVEGKSKSLNDYYFSRMSGSWGWATWRARWREYDRYLERWPDLRRCSALSEILDRRRDVRYWTGIFDLMFKDGRADVWDYQWLYTNLFGHRLSIVPTVNLITNIGFGMDSTHTREADPRFLPKLKSVEFPLRHPPAMVAARSLDRRYQKLYFRPIVPRILRRIRRLVARRERKFILREPGACDR